MTETQMNGPSTGKFIDSIDPDDPEYIKSLIRPAEVKEDVQQMAERKRVSMILNANSFRKELEEIAIDQMKNGPSPAGLLALQQLSELMVPRGGAPFSATETLTSKVKAKIIPIADIRGTDTMNFTKGEKLLRCKLASLYRLLDIFGWSAGIHAYITARISQDYEHFLILPHGMMYHEVTAGSLAKCDMAGEVVDPGTTGLGINKQGFGLHGALHAARPDIKCIIHLRTPATVALSSMDCGLLPLCSEAISLGEISTTDYAGSLPDQEAKDKLARALGPNNKILLLKNFGILIGGESIDEAFLLAQNVMTAVETQLQTLPIGLDRIVLPSEEVRKKAYDAANQQPQPNDGGTRQWRKGQLEFEGYMRHLDNAGYRTGHVYHEPLLRNSQKREKLNSEIEYPPTATSFASMYEGDPDKLSPLRTHFEKQKKAFKTDWLNTPNAYKREEIQEVGTPNPKKITKWVSDTSPNAQPTTPVKVGENPNLFAPQGANPKEYKQNFQKIKKEYYTESITAGPQSRILDGVTWEEAQKIKDGHVSGTSDSVIIVGAASKGIIQRDHQHNAVVYKTYYAPNPFDSMTEDEIEQYKKQVEGSGGEEGAGEPAPKHEEEDEMVITPGPDGKLISTEERMAHVKEGKPMAPTTIEVTQQAYQEPPREDTADASGAAPAIVIATAAGRRAPEPEPQPLQRSNSAGKADQRKPVADDFDRNKSKSMPRPKKNKGTVNGDQLASPTKSTTSGEGTLDERSSREGSPTKELAADGSPTKEKKKKKFRMPSFSKKKEKKEKK